MKTIIQANALTSARVPCLVHGMKIGISIGLGLLASAAQANCGVVKTALEKAEKHPSNYSLIATRSEDGTFKPALIRVQVGTTVYVKALGTPLPMQVSDVNAAETKAIAADAMKSLLEGTCPVVGTDTVAGIKATGYSYETTTFGMTSKITTWINNANGLPVRSDVMNQSTGALKWLEKLLPKDGADKADQGSGRTAMLYSEKAKPPAQDGSIDAAVMNKLLALLK
jgi:hypothetical protein